MEKKTSGILLVLTGVSLFAIIFGIPLLLGINAPQRWCTPVSVGSNSASCTPVNPAGPDVTIWYGFYDPDSGDTWEERTGGVMGKVNLEGNSPTGDSGQLTCECVWSGLTKDGQCNLPVSTACPSGLNACGQTFKPSSSGETSSITDGLVSTPMGKNTVGCKCWLGNACADRGTLSRINFYWSGTAPLPPECPSEYGNNPKSECPTCQLSSGNNNVVYKGMAGDIEDAVSGIRDKIDMIYLYEGGSWYSYVPDRAAGNTLTELKTGSCYLFTMKSSATWGGLSIDVIITYSGIIIAGAIALIGGALIFI